MRVKNPSIPIALSLLALTACGGGGGGGNNNNAPAPSAGLSSLTASALTAPADGATDILLTAIVRDVAGDALGGRTVRFDVIGNGVTVQPPLAIASSDGIATALLRSTLPGTVTVSAVVSPDSAAVRLDQTLSITFTAANAPVVAGPARYDDVDGDGAANAGDRVVVRFSEPVVVTSGFVTDFVLPVQGDSFGNNALVAAGPGDDEVTITLGASPRLRTRGAFDAAELGSNAPSGIDVQAGAGIVSAATAQPVVPSAATDVAAGQIERAGQLIAGGLLAVGDINADAEPDCVVVDGGTLTPFANVGGVLVPAAPATGQAPVAIRIGNLNRTGNAEVVTGDAIGVRIWRQTSLPGGTPVLEEQSFIASGAANDLEILDVDQDAFPDLVIGTVAGVIIAIHQRNGGNTYAIGQSVFLPGPVERVRTVDLDADGDRDVLALVGATLRILRNDGGTFVEDGQIAVSSVASLSAGDVDGDGIPEVLVAGQGAAQLFIRQPNGSYLGSPVAVAAEQAALLDLDRDARADIVARTAVGLELLQNDRNGGFATYLVEGSSTAADFGAADLDRDGDLDLLLLELSQLRTFEGGSAGTFGDTVLAERQQLGTSAVSKQELVDVDGDGRRDRVVLTAVGAEVWTADGVGGFTLAGSFASAQSVGPTAFAFGDVDGDGDVDCVLGFDGAGNEAFVNDGQGQFTFAWAFSAAACRSLALTDFDADGDLDVFVGNDGTNEVYRNDSSGGAVQFFLDGTALQNVLPLALGNETIALLPFDFDRDGDEDMVVVNGGDLTAPQDAFLLRNNGPGFGYAVANQLNAQLLATGAAIGDIDGDGREDLAIAQLSSNGSATVKWFRGFSLSISTQPTNVASNGQYFSRSLVIADMDGDGRSDFVIGDVSVSNQPIAVLRQRADGSFEVGQEFPTTRLESVHAGDFDSDGDIDLVTVETTGPSRVLENR